MGRGEGGGRRIEGGGIGEGGGESFRCFHNCYEVPANAVKFMMRSI